MTLYIADTSAVLNGVCEQFPTASFYISPYVAYELENIKNSEKPERIKAQARKAVKMLIEREKTPKFVRQTKVNKFLVKHDFLPDTIDSRILAEAFIAGEKEGAIFQTSDGAQYLLAKQLEASYPRVSVQFFEPKEAILTKPWSGYNDYTPTEEQLVALYSNPTENVLGAKTNEFCKIFDGEELKDILFWDGNKYKGLRYKTIKNPYTQETIAPRNLEQKMALHVLQDNEIKIKLLTSAWGGGKTLLALNYALEQVSKGNYQKIIYVRNNIIVNGTNDVGYLKGDLIEKMSIWGGPIADHVGGQIALEELINQELIEIFPLSHVRGRSFRNVICLCDECENMDDKLVTLLLSRIEESSEIIFCGDLRQIDSRRFEKNNGITSMVNNLAGERLFGMVNLVKSERGPVASLCDKMRPPI